MPDWLQNLIRDARQQAVQLQHPYIRSEHLYLAILKQGDLTDTTIYENVYAIVKRLPAPGCGAEQRLTLARGAQLAVDRLTAQSTPADFARLLRQSSPVVRRVLNELKGMPDATPE